MSFRNASTIQNNEAFLHVAVLPTLILAQLTVFYTDPNDFRIHSGFFLKLLEQGTSFPGNPIYYSLPYLTQSIFSLDQSGLTIAGILFACIAKIALYFIVLQQFLQASTSRFRAILLSGAICIAFSIADPVRVLNFHHYYLGSISPNLYHNPTTILSLPFALLTYIAATRNSTYFKTISFAVACAMIKPSFLLSFGPSLGLMWLIGQRNMKQLGLSIAMISVILIQYILIYHLETGSVEESASGITLSYPFLILQRMNASWYLPLALLSSFAFPIWQIVKENKLSTATMNFIVAFIIAAALKETGPRELHGNFLWQASIASFILFFEGGKQLLNDKSKTGSILLLAHCLSGLLYPLWMVLTGTYK